MTDIVVEIASNTAPLVFLRGQETAAHLESGPLAHPQLPGQLRRAHHVVAEMPGHDGHCGQEEEELDVRPP